MDHKTLALLKPMAETASAIEAAINGAAKARDDAKHRGIVAKAELAADTLTLTSKGRRDLKDVIDDAAADVLQIDGIVGTLEGRLREALRIESWNAAKAAHASLTARITAHEALFLSVYREHQKSIIALLNERKSVANDAMAHNAIVASLGEFQIAGIDELERAGHDTRFYQTQQEIAAEKDLEEAERMRAYYERRELIEERNRIVREYAANRPAPAVIISQPSGVNMVTTHV